MKRAEAVLRHEVAEISSLLSVAFDSGLGFVAAIEEVSSKSTGTLSASFRELMKSLELGGNLYEELAMIRSKHKQPATDELMIKFQTALQFGTPISQQLANLARSNRALVAQFQLTEAAKRENLMLLPLVFLILPITVIFAIYPSLQYLNLKQ